jgi:uncharacterized phage protein (TIGR02216 family)
MTQVNWPALMRAGLQGLRLRPWEFWRLTPAELRLMLGEAGRQAPMTRGGLDALMALYPDTQEGKGSDGR